MTKEEEETLMTIADILDDNFLKVYLLDHTYGYYLRWCAAEIRKVIKKEDKK